MAITAEQVAKVTANLDAIVTAECKTADLNMNQNLLGDFVGAGQVKVAKMAIDGLGNYDRKNGFPDGDVDLAWEVLSLEYDRGREFQVDAMDDDEHALIMSSNIMAEFERAKVVPEVDAARFARLSAKAGTKAAGITLTTTNVMTKLLEAEAAVAENAELDGCIIYMTQVVKNLIREKQSYRLGQGENINGKFETFDDMKVVTVPQSRFYSAIDLYDGVTSDSVDQTVGGYAKASAGKAINFMIVDPSACAAIAKHQRLRYFAPDINQERDAHKWQYRLFHDMLVYGNKAERIYVCTQ